MDPEYDPLRLVESCPFCGSLLSSSLEKRHLVQKISRHAIFRKASSIPRMTFDIAKLDGIIQFLRPGQKLEIVGNYSQKLIERLCVRAQLPKRYGGLDSTVIVIDGANSSDPYLGISLARQYGMSVEKVLSKIITSRAFTIHQLASLIICELPNIISKYDSKFVAISNITEMFSDDPYLDPREAESILQEIANSISKLQDCLVVVSITKQTKFDHIITNSCDRIIKISKRHKEISFEIDNNEPVLVKEAELEIVAR